MRPRDLPHEPKPVRGRLALVTAGTLSLILGLLGLAIVAGVLYGQAPAWERLGLRLGLAGGALLSLAAQVLALLGAWALWRGARR